LRKIIDLIQDFLIFARHNMTPAMWENIGFTLYSSPLDDLPFVFAQLGQFIHSLAFSGLARSPQSTAFVRQRKLPLSCGRFAQPTLSISAADARFLFRQLARSLRS
jgi:hypothetical protein